MSRYFTLLNGLRMPKLGYGTYLLQDKAAQEALDFGLHLGYRHIDTAYSYQNAALIGEVLQDNLRRGAIKRKELFVTTKVPPIYMAAKDVAPSVEESLEQLQLNYVDMLLIHTPFGLKNLGNGDLFALDAEGRRTLCHHDLLEAWTELESLMARGWTKNIGASNFSVEQMERIWNAGKEKPSNLQSECHVYWQQNELRKYCNSKGIAFTGYAPLGAPGRPADRRTPEDLDLLGDPTVKEISEQIRKTPAQVILRFLMELNVIPLPKSASKARVQENWEIWDFELNDASIKKLRTLDEKIKYFKFEFAEEHPEYQGLKAF